MMSGVLKILFLVFLSNTVFGSVEWCYGKNMSANGTSEVNGLYAMVDKKPCTHVIGDIFLINLSHVTLPTEIYRRVRKVYGSIIVINNTHIETPIHFPNLRSINATELPAITILGNENVLLSVGDSFRQAISKSRHGITFAVMRNKNFMINTDQYNIWYLAAHPNSKFLIDSSLLASVCAENFFKPIAGIMGFLFVTLSVAFSTVAFFDRPKNRYRPQN